MKALSIWQPWASAIASGVKQYETRSWPTKYRGPIAICASKKWNDDLFELAAEYLGRWPGFPEDWPLGAVVATAHLVECRRTEDMIADIGLMEITLGDFSPGRFAWRLESVVKIPPIEYRGRQGLFEIPDGVIANGV